MIYVSSRTGRRSPLPVNGREHGGGMHPRPEADDPDDTKASTRWHELVSELAKPAHSSSTLQLTKQTADEPVAAKTQNSPPEGGDSDSQTVRTTLEKAVQAAKADSQWSASGLPESLQRTVQLCSSEGPDAAKTAALGLLDFHQIVKKTKLRSPKTPSPPVSPEREDERQGSKPGHTSIGVLNGSRPNSFNGDADARLVTSGSHDLGKGTVAKSDMIGHQARSGQTDNPARVIMREAHKSSAGPDNQQQEPSTQAQPQVSSTSQPTRQAKEGVSPIALQVATLMRDHLRSIQASGVLPAVSLELPAVPQLQLDSNVGVAHSTPAATGQQIAVINSCPLLVIPSALPLPPEPSLYRPVRPNRSISSPGSEAPQRPSQPIRCISAPSRLPAEFQPLRPGNVISSGVPQAHPRYRDAGRLAPSPVTKPGQPAAKPAEVQVRVVHAPARAGAVRDSKPEGEPLVRRSLSSPATTDAASAEAQLAGSTHEGRSISPLYPASRSVDAQTPNSTHLPQNGSGKAERLHPPMRHSGESPFAHGESNRNGEGVPAHERSPTPEDDKSPKRRRLDMQKALSLNTVLRCVDAKDTHSSKDEALDAHVGEAPTTIEDMAAGEGETSEPQRRLPTTKSAPTQTITPMLADAAQRPGRRTPSPPLLHQMVRQVCEAVGETWRNSLQQHIQSSLSALGPAPQPLHSGSSPQHKHVGPSGLPAGTLSIYGGCASGETTSPGNSPGRPAEGALSPDAAAAAVGRGFHLGDMPPCDSMANASKTALWSGKVKHKHGGSVVELFHMTALIPEQYLERLPPTLFASELANRNNVKLRQQVYVMRCKLGFLSDRQLHKLHMLAHLKLVAICHLQHVTITLVPYYNSQNGFKVVAFMLADD